MSNSSSNNDPILDGFLTKQDLDLLAITVRFASLVARSEFSLIKTYRIKINETAKAELNYEKKGYQAVINGLADFYLTNYDDAIGHLNEALERSSSPDLNGLSHMLLGATSRSQGKIDLAVKHLSESEVLLKPSEYFREYFTYVYYQLGEIYLGINEFDLALGYYHQGLQVANEDMLPTVSFRLQNGLGNCLLKVNRTSESEEMLTNAVSISGISIAEKSRGLCDLGSFYIEMEKFDAAEQNLRESLSLRTGNELVDASSTSMIELAKLYLKTSRYHEAKELLDRAYNISIEFKSESKRIVIEQLLAETFFQLEKWNEAADSFRQSYKNTSELRTKREHQIFKLKNAQIEEKKEALADKNTKLKTTLDEIAQLRRNRKSLIFSIVTGVILVLLTELFLDPFIEEVSYNGVISISAKVVIALLLKPMESLYDRILFNRAIKRN